MFIYPPTPLAARGAPQRQEALTIIMFGIGGSTVLEASFESVDKATFSTGSRRPKDPIRPSLSWCFGCCIRN